MKNCCFFGGRWRGHLKQRHFGFLSPKFIKIPGIAAWLFIVISELYYISGSVSVFVGHTQIWNILEANFIFFSTPPPPSCPPPVPPPPPTPPKKRKKKKKESRGEEGRGERNQIETHTWTRQRTFPAGLWWLQETRGQLSDGRLDSVLSSCCKVVWSGQDFCDCRLCKGNDCKKVLWA